MEKLTNKEKTKLEDNAVVTNRDDLIDAKIEARAIKTEKLIVEENNMTRDEVKELKNLVIELKNSKVNDIIQYILIAGLIFTMIITRGCTPA